MPKGLLGTVSKFWANKVALPYSEFQDLSDALKPRAFAIAGAENQALASELYRSLLEFIQEGGSDVGAWAADAQGILDKFGGEALHGFTGSTENSWYADMVVRTNVQQALASGRYELMFDELGMTIPYWRYTTAGDGRVRPSHAALSGMVFSKLDPASYHYLPPLGFNCRCMAIEVPPSQTKRVQRFAQTGAGIRAKGIVPDDGWDYNRLSALTEFTPLKRTQQRA